jgi:hypothetical protein
LFCAGDGGVVDLSIIPQPGLVLPFLLSTSGVITTATSLDRENRASYSFYVMATDRGAQPLSSSVLVTVIVNDVNDNAPSFVYSSGNDTSGPDVISVPLGSQFVVASVHAVDADSGDNGIVVYSVVGGNASNLFRVEPATGAVVTLVDLDTKHLGVYHLIIRAEDRGHPPLYSDRNMTLRVMPRSSGDGQGGLSAGSGSSSDGDQYVVIVVCIVVFTIVVSMGVIVTMCVLRKLDRDRKLKYTAACYPPDNAPHMEGLGGDRDGDNAFGSSDYHQQVRLLQCFNYTLCIMPAIGWKQVKLLLFYLNCLYTVLYTRHRFGE